MGKRFLVFGDSHGVENLKAIREAGDKIGVDGYLFTGDKHYKLTSPITSMKGTKAESLAESFTNPSKFLEDAKKGVFSDKILEKIIEEDKKTSEVISRSAKSEKELFDSVFSDVDIVGVEGNWGREEDEASDGEVKDIGVKVLALSGGGPHPGNKSGNKRKGELSDNYEEDKPDFGKWRKAIKSSGSDINIMLSHISPSERWLTHPERSSEILERAIRSGEKSGFNPELYVHGHEHGADVRYDKELDAVVMRPGACGVNHNKGNPTFMTVEMDDDGKVASIDKYEIKSMLKGIMSIKLVESYSVNYDKKEIDKKEKDEDLIKEENIEILEKDLSVDKNYELMDTEMSFDFSGLSPEEKEELIEKDVAIFISYGEKVADEMEKIMNRSFNTFENSGGKNLRGLAGSVFDALADEAMKKYGANLDHIDDDFKKRMIKSALVRSIYGVGEGDIYSTISDDAKDIDSAKKNFSKLSGAGSKDVGEYYRDIFMKNLSKIDASHLQDIVDMYIPLNYERTEDLSIEDAKSLWITLYNQGILTPGDLSDYDAFESKKDFEKNKKTPDELSEMFRRKIAEEVVEEPGLQPEVVKDAQGNMYLRLNEDGSVMSKNDKEVVFGEKPSNDYQKLAA